jgi:DNA mismatch repair protein MutL
MSGYSGDKKAIADEALYRMACKSAVKAHKKLDPREIEALLESLSSLENPFTCPPWTSGYPEAETL